MITVEGRVALRLDEFMLRLGHLVKVSKLASSIEGRPRRLEKDLATALTETTPVDENHNEPVAEYVFTKRLCADATKAAVAAERSRDYRYPNLETFLLGNGTILGVRSLDESPVTVWWQDFWLSDKHLPSALGSVTVGGRTGSSTGVSHIIDWAMILGLLNRDFSASIEANLLARISPQRPGVNPFLLSSEEKIVLAYVIFSKDIDALLRLATQILNSTTPIRKSDGAKLFGRAIEVLSSDADTDRAAAHRAQTIVFEQMKELKAAIRKTPDQPLGASSTAWHRASSRLETLVDLGLLTKSAGAKKFRFEYVYFATDLLRRVHDSIRAAESATGWLEGPFIDFFSTASVPCEHLETPMLFQLVTPLVKLLGRPVGIFPIEALALGISALASSQGLRVPIGTARASLEELARVQPDVARLSRGTISTRAEFISLDFTKR